MNRYKPGQKGSVLVARRGRFMWIECTFGSEPLVTWRLEVAPDATADQRRHFASLTGPPSSLPSALAR